MFVYFPDNYGWSNLVMASLNTGGQISELDNALASLRAIEDKTSPDANGKAFEAFQALGDRMEALGDRALSLGFKESAGRKLLKAASYLLVAEMFINAKDDRKIPTYKKGIAAFRKGVEALGEDVEFVEVPFEGTTLPALFVKGRGDGPLPTVVHYDGFDWNKELMYLLERQDLAERGVSMLLIDTPGVGGARRLRDLPLRHDTEGSAAAAFDYLAARDDVDLERVGLLGISMGGYYVPRAAAFEKRYACVAAWGGLYDFGAVLAHEEEQGTESMPDQAFHGGWVMGEQDPEKLRAKYDKLTLEGVLDKITCPLLVVHGKDDVQIPQWHAERTVEEATNAPVAYLRLFGKDEGGSGHVHIDNMKVGSDYMFDWLSAVLKSTDPAAEAKRLADIKY